MVSHPPEDDQVRDYAAQLIAQAEGWLAQATGTSAHTVKLTRWEQRMFRAQRASHAPLATTAAAFDEQVDYAEDLLTDVFAYLWLSTPVVLDRSEVLPTRWDNHRVLRAMSIATEVETLRTATVHDEVASAMAIVWLSESIRRWLRENDEPDADEVLPKLAQAIGALADALADHEADPSGGTEDITSATTALQEAFDAAEDGNRHEGLVPTLNDAAGQAAQRLDDLAGLGSMLGLSTRGQQTGEGTGMGKEAVWALLQRLSRSDVARFAELVGRFTAAARRGRHASPVPHGVDLSDRVWDADASELAARTHRLLRLEHLERLAAAELITDSFTGAPELEGPMVLVVDESSSMTFSGQGGVSRRVWAKAFALAMVAQAREARRKVVLISFASDYQLRVWHEPGPVELVEFVEHFFNGGTSYEPALDAALTVVEDAPGMRSADIVLVTDDDRADVPRAWLTGWTERRDQVKPVPPRLRGVGVDVRTGAWLRRVADDVTMITDFTSEAQVARAAHTF